jgi:hypothetical protein
VTIFRREAGAIFWWLLALPVLAAAVALAEGTVPVTAGAIRLEIVLSVAGTGLACFGYAQHKAEKNVEEMRRDREKDIRAAIAVHDASTEAHRVAADHNHRPLEGLISSLSMRLHDTENSFERLENGQGRMIGALDDIKEVLFQLKAEHEAWTGGDGPGCAPMRGAANPNYPGPFRRKDDPKGRA